MIIILHSNNKVVKVFDYSSKADISVTKNSLVETFFELANQYKNTLLVWCHNNLKDDINFEEFDRTFHHKLIMGSLNTKAKNYIDDRIGYVESSPFVKINKEVYYPTWLMASCIGGINSDVLSCYNVKDYLKKPFDYTLNSIAKLGMKNGLFCYSMPKLLNPNINVTDNNPTSKIELFKFIKQHYKSRWILLAFLNSLIYEKRLLLLPLITSFFIAKKFKSLNFKDLEIVSKASNVLDTSLDVIIPTIGRKLYLYDVLKDLSNQTLLPKNVIIIEQNPDFDSKTELDYLTNETWPFKIKHQFTNKTGACNARNLALKEVESDWVFMADDDIRFEKKVLEIALEEMFKYKLSAATLSCLRKGDKQLELPTSQWNTFGSGCSIISKHIAKNIKFDIAFEHGFGEDGDYGMQIRNYGEDIGYISKCRLIHLKAPMGGFRTKFKHSWIDDKIQPKPSPTIMLYNLKNQSNFQINGYRTLLFIKFFKLQENKNVFSYYSQIKKRWKKSIYLANKLKDKH
ncbi:glycosyltransferase family A protein [Algibacter aquimarinus]|uniref:Glycosyltransferase family A protein n=1 Tax=Algibacter aquimarinus TaxID=1136748 RepID=A0ABP9HPY8_9FLAO